ncbi:MAG: hypothetical protein NT028_10500 [candidate division Zixibacteria bacterium]|nr:hypothetical protein [candidate division Zixibacteria bacterium]
MKRIVSALMIVVWLATIVGGCQTESPSGANVQDKSSSNNKFGKLAPPTEIFLPRIIEVSDGSVELVSRTLDRARSAVVFDLRMRWNDGTQESLLLSAGIRIVGDSTQCDLWTRLADTGGKVLWGYDLANDLSEPNVLSISEASSNDQLTIRIDRRDSRSQVETHTWANGNRFVYEFTREALEQVEAGRALTTELETELDGLRQQFDSTYDFGSSLNSNKYGFLTNDLISNDLIDRESIPAGDGLAYNKILLPICMLLQSGAYAKCFLGGPANALCWALAISAFVCYVFNAILDLLGV